MSSCRHSRQVCVHHIESPPGHHRSLSKTNGWQTLALDDNTTQNFSVGLKEKERTNAHHIEHSMLGLKLG